MDAGTLSALLIGIASLIGWLVSQANARSKALRGELRWRRKREQLLDRYIYRLEQSHSKHDLELPPHPPGWDELEAEEW